MPGRIVPLVKDQIYHIFNKGIASQPTFLDRRDYARALDIMFYYQNAYPPVSYSRFLGLSTEEREDILKSLKNHREFLVEIIAYCLMPNHFHFLLKQISENGISKFMGNFINSYTRFFNTKHERTGQLYSGRFKAVRIETDSQLLHVSRYIHLNPYTSYVVKTLNELETYPYSSFNDYVISQPEFDSRNKAIILDHFKKQSYKQFVFDQAEYQKTLAYIKHLVLD